MASRSLNNVAISDVLDEDSFIGVDSIFDGSDIDPDFMEEDETHISEMLQVREKSGEKTELETREKSGNPVSSQGISTLVREKYKIPLHK
ncbi:hypothetical protein J6590_059646 [Homalodisca vitripennis]|nr:hypothetical protein J6590_059646 [Homalodisca vitripennis]